MRRVEAELYRRFAELEDTHWWFVGRRAVIRKVLARTLTPREGRTVLDVGCGTGGMFPVLRELGTVEGLESSPQALAYCREGAGRGTVVHQGELPDGLPRGRRYDVITLFDVLEHLDSPKLALSRLHDALVPGGTLVCTVPAFQFLWSEHDEVNHHRRRYTRRLLERQLVDAGLRPTWVTYFNSLLFPVVAAVRLSQRWWGRSRSGEPQADLAPTPAPANWLLRHTLGAEGAVVSRWQVPFGVSLLAVAKRGA